MCPRMPALSLFLVLLLVPWGNADDSDPDPANFDVWGPGLESDFHMPVRYFYIQPVNKAGKNLTSRLPDNFVLHVRYTDGRRPVAYTTVDYIGDGLYVFRMRLHHSIEDGDLSIKISYQNQEMRALILRGPLFAEECHCPHRSFHDWTERMKCPATFPQMEKDFAAFPSIDMKDVMQRFLSKIFNKNSVAACRYIVSNNQIFRKCFGQHVGFHIFSDAILLSLSRKVVLPDLDFIWNLGDWPLSHDASSPVPILSWCGSDSTFDIVMPTYELTESVLEMMGRTSIDLFSIMAKTRVPWSQKDDKAFFRGRDSSSERLDLVRLSSRRPGDVDARLTNMFFFKNDSSLGQRAPYVSLFDFFSRKYQVNMDGTVSAYRTPYLLAGQSVMLKQQSPYYEHFYAALRENEHFVPLRRDIGDLLEKISWLRANDAKARRIAKVGRKFAFHNLSPRDVFCYYARLFERYSSRMTSFEAKSPGPGFERVTKTEYVAPERCRCSALHDEL